jgi:hypothetical protein
MNQRAIYKVVLGLEFSLTRKGKKGGAGLNFNGALQRWRRGGGLEEGGGLLVCGVCGGSAYKESRGVVVRSKDKWG